METKDVILIGMLGALLLLSILLMIWNLVSPFLMYNRRRIVILRMNNEYVRNILRGNGFILSKEALDDRVPILYSLDGKVVQGCADEGKELVPFKRIHWQMIDCGMSLSIFVYELHKTAWRMS